MEEQAVLKSTKAELSTLNVKELFFKYIRYLPFYIISVALALFVTFGYLRYATEFYRSTGSIVIKDDKSSSGNDNNKIDLLMQQESRKNIQTETEVLQSRQVVARVVEALNLNFVYTAVGKIKELDVYDFVPFKLEALKINDSASAFEIELHFVNQHSFQVNKSKEAIAFNQPFSTPKGTFRLIKTKNQDVGEDYKVSWYPTEVRANGLLGGLIVVPKQNAPILTASMETTNPQLAADFVNRLLREYQAVTIEDKNAITLQKLEFIDARLDSVSRQLDSINDRYVAFRQKNNVISPGVQSESYLKRSEEADKAIREQKVQVETVHQIEDYLRGSNESLTVPSSLTIQDPVLNALVLEYNKAQQERSELLKNAPEANVVVQQKTAEVENLRKKILVNTQNIKKSFGAVVGSLQSSNSNALAQISSIPTKERELLDIQRELQSKAEIYNTLLAKREEAAITLAATISNTKILQEAQPDNTPIKPNRRGAKILAVLLGLLLPTIAVVMIELFNDKVTSRNDIERLTQVTLLGEVGHNYSKETLLVTSGNRKVIAEQFRILRSNLQYFLTHVEKPVLLVTSSFSGEGKSFISTNMGAVMALANKKTIILEFDIRKPKVLSQLNMGKRPGLTNYLLGKVKADELPVPVEGQSNLFVLPCGPVPPNPSELLLDPKLDELFAYLKQNFDVIVMDTAPVGMVSDALTLSKYADCTLYIVRQGHTYKKQLGLIDEYYREGKLPKISIVLNDAKLRSGYGNYGYGGYGYGYGEGYFEEEEKKHGVGKWLGWLGFKNGVETKNKKAKV